MQPAFGMAEVATCITYQNHFDFVTGVHRFRKSSLGGKLVRASDGDQNAIDFIDLGPPIPGVRIRIVDKHGRVLPEAVIGRLQIEGDIVTPGYLNNAAAESGGVRWRRLVQHRRSRFHPQSPPDHHRQRKGDDRSLRRQLLPVTRSKISSIGPKALYLPMPLLAASRMLAPAPKSWRFFSWCRHEGIERRLESDQEASAPTSLASWV